MKSLLWILVLIFSLSLLFFYHCDSEINDIIECAYCANLGVKSISDTGDGKSVRIAYTVDVEENSSQNLANYTLTTEAGDNIIIEAAARSADALNIVTLTTKGLTGSETFLLTIRSVAGINSVKPIPDEGIVYTFNLVVSTLDNSPPKYFYPATGTVFTNTDITLQWTSVVGAIEYTVEVATDENFTNPISQSPFTISTPELALPETLEDNLYYWRVRANTTTPGEYSNIGGNYSSFALISEAVHVYCASDDEICSDAGKLGTQNSPLQTIAGGIEKSIALGVNNVYIANRGNDTPYNEIVFIENGINLYGGYTFTDGVFTKEDIDILDNRTRIQAPGSLFYGNTCVYVENIHFDTIIEGFDITGKEENTNKDAICVFVNNSDSVILNKNTINGERSEYKYSRIIYIVQSEIVLTNNHINAPSIANGMAVYAINCIDSSVSIIGNTIKGGVSSSEYGIIDDSESSLLIANNFIDLSQTFSGNQTYGIQVRTESIICNNLIISKGEYAARGIDVIGCTSDIFNNHFILASGTYNRAINAENSATPKICNNLFQCDGNVDCWGIYEHDNDADPTRVLNNNFFNFDNDYLYRDFDAGCGGDELCNLVELNLLTPASDNIDEDLTSSLDTDYRFTGDLGSFTFDTAGINGGHSTYNWDLGSIGYTDFDGTNRTPQDDSSTTGWSIGPYEYDG